MEAHQSYFTIMPNLLISYQTPAGSVTGKTVVVVPKNLNIRSGPGATFSILSSLQGEAKLSVLEKAINDSE